jgi:hypothetical protein
MTFAAAWWRYRFSARGGEGMNLEERMKKLRADFEAEIVRYPDRFNTNCSLCAGIARRGV